MNDNHGVSNWIIRFVKGMFVGSGAILPGVSGGALAAIFGFYEPLISFLADIRHQFKKNVYYFLPVFLGALFGVFVLAIPIDYGLKYYPVHVLWAFIGAILGTLPSLWKEAGKEGREGKHVLLTVATAILFFLLLVWANNNLNIHVEQNFVSWLLAGLIFASGMVVPGLSPSNFLIYLNLYQPLTEGIRKLDLSIIIPVGIGALACILLLSKLMRHIMDYAYAGVMHFVFGVVIASTAIIAPSLDLYAGFSTVDYLLVALLCIGGMALGYWMGQLEDKYK